MRTAFVSELQELVRAGADIWLVTGDLGYSVLEPFAAEFPDRFLNAGVAEQTMLGLAAGIARRGPTVIVYSIGNFPTFRALEQLRNDIAYPQVPVITVSVGSGFSYGPHGSTHHAIEDLSVMRALPGMCVVSPGDPQETKSALRALVALRGPGYLRLGKAGERDVGSLEREPFTLGKARCVRPGHDITVVATGSILAVAEEAVTRLMGDGVDAALFSMHTLRPFDDQTILRAVRSTRGLVAVEEHRETGGLRTAIAEALLAAGAPSGSVRCLAIDQDQRFGTGSQGHLRGAAGLSADDIVRVARELFDSA